MSSFTHIRHARLKKNKSLSSLFWTLIFPLASVVHLHLCPISPDALFPISWSHRLLVTAGLLSVTERRGKTVRRNDFEFDVAKRKALARCHRQRQKAREATQAQRKLRQTGSQLTFTLDEKLCCRGHSVLSNPEHIQSVSWSL